MSEPPESRNFPNPERLSILAAMILLAYALASFVNIPGRQLSVQLPGLYLEVQFNTRKLIAMFVAGLTATGADWMLRDHPALGRTRTIQHWFLPALTALVIGLPLSQMPLGPQWWLGFFFGGIILMLVLVAEYIVVDPTDVRHAPASMMLTAISFALFLALTVTLRGAGLRLFLILPAIIFAGGLVSLRTFNLRLLGRWAYVPAGVMAILVGQLAAALYYWPISPVSYGLLLLGPAYAITSFLTSTLEGEAFLQAMIEPLIVLTIIVGAAIWIN